MEDLNCNQVHKRKPTSEELKSARAENLEIDIEKERAAAKNHQKEHHNELSFVCRTTADAFKILTKVDNLQQIFQEEESYSNLLNILLYKCDMKLTKTTEWNLLLQEIQKKKLAFR